MFLTERKRQLLRALHAGGQDAATLSARFDTPMTIVREDLRDLRSYQLLTSYQARVDGRTIEVWELTERGRRHIAHIQQLELRGIRA